MTCGCPQPVLVSRVMKPRLWHATSVLMVLCSCGSESTTDLGTDAGLGPTTDSNVTPSSDASQDEAPSGNMTPSPDASQDGAPWGDAELDSPNQSVDSGSDSAPR